MLSRSLLMRAMSLPRLKTSLRLKMQSAISRQNRRVVHAFKDAGRAGYRRAQAGRRADERSKQQIEDLLRARRETLKRALMQRRLTAEAIDVTLPGRGIGPG